MTGQNGATEREMVTRVFALEWDKGHGPLWMNSDNLMSCVPKGIEAITDVTDDQPDNPGLHERRVRTN